MLNAKEIFAAEGSKAVSLRLISKAELASLPAALKLQAQSLGFEASPLSLMPVLSANGAVQEFLVGAPSTDADPFALGAISSKLPPGTYECAAATHLTALGWALELYRYDPFRPAEAKKVKLVLPKGVDEARLLREVDATFLVRDLINTPANILGPDELEAAARKIARAHKAAITVISGKKLEKEFPLIHVVGAAATRAPRLIDFTWGNPKHPKVTLVGKGVVFDTGGLDIKPSSSMLLMKKDMGGAANVLGLAQMVMEAKLPVRLRVLVPAVENAIAGDAFRPGDVFKTRKGLTVEIGNTDAEGRLILADALALADEEAPDLLIDMATLTGAARVALGPDLPPFYTDDAALAASLNLHGMKENDPLWQLPLWRPYYSLIETPIADLNNAGAGGFAGSITAALFLCRFVEKAKAYAHFDIFGWVPNTKPGRPKGGEAQAMRALFAVIAERFAK
ncbi:leucyl aminopeptidase family protein [Aestuariivirga litoralis]|uniref:leucyl aminopeptidase family protein n=1 Tax=Aestuariivirga litoralis TaxID=2650924 RepID=UPI0018C4B6A4|nr:leucyl aminopeptidase family protein [Aestuariivirga litoralis]MBG1232777.1 leucyl aminopeptidase family protein [Aestuariivirga litoralis]